MTVEKIVIFDQRLTVVVRLELKPFCAPCVVLGSVRK